MTWSRNSDGVAWQGAGPVLARKLIQKPGALKGWILAIVLAVVAGPFIGLIMPARAIPMPSGLATLPSNACTYNGEPQAFAPRALDMTMPLPSGVQ